MLTAVSVSAFILGILVSRPKRHRKDDPYNVYDDDEEEQDERPKGRRDTLSDEDRDYIS
ncbi:hypothetical protein GCM10011425_14030 [Mucilaginibacter galii]|uniref:Uncharacterized protein n=2 Tax=Mucilaginibacter galii TaxID=2005073 RepID=A0A917J814_9SPHI|nr:hypothetical protein GCM10011425_14030 [Mucilaginibacter galii]